MMDVANICTKVRLLDAVSGNLLTSTARANKAVNGHSRNKYLGQLLILVTQSLFKFDKLKPFQTLC